MSQNDNDHDVRGESMSKTTRRGLLGALGVAGLASLGSSGASANLSGGPEADAMAEHRVPYYRVPESELDSPGVVGRRVEIAAGGSNWSAGDQLVDTGSSWELIDSGVGSLSAEDVNNEKHVLADDSNPVARANAAQSELFNSNEYGDTGGRVVFESPDTHIIDEVIDLIDGVMLTGESVRGSVLRADPDFDGEAMIRFRPDTRTFFAGMEWLRVDGNDPNGAATKGVIVDGANGGEPNDMHHEHLIIRNTAEEGLLLEHIWGHRWNEILVEGCGTGDGTGSNAAVDINPVNESGREQLHADQWFVFGNHADWGMIIRDVTGSHPNVWQDLWIRSNDYGGLRVEEDDQTFSDLHVIDNSGADPTNHDGMEIAANRITINGGHFNGKGNEQRGLALSSNDSKISVVTFQRHDFINVGVNGNRNVFLGCQFNNGVRINGGADNEFVGCNFSNTSTFERTDGTRTRWNGVIGGGPLGGEDLGSLTGASAGDRALANGTTAPRADVVWTFNGTDWVSPDSSEANITPA